MRNDGFWCIDMRKEHNINLIWFSLGVFSVVVMTKLSSYLAPHKLYFTFSSFLYSSGSFMKWESLAIKLLIPFIVGFLIFYVPFLLLQSMPVNSVRTRSIYDYLRNQSVLTARASAFFAALLLAWPLIVHWDILISPALRSLRTQYLLVYFIYFVAYSYFAGSGVYFAHYILRNRLPSVFNCSTDGGVSWILSLQSAVIGVITSAIATNLISLIATSTK